MKKMCFLLSAAVMSLAACTKTETAATKATTETVNASVNSGESYKLALPAGSTATITSQAAHADNSVISTTSTGEQMYVYTAPANYQGTDEVTVLATPPQPMHHQCMHHNDSTNNQTVTYNIHLTINGTGKG